MKNKQIITTEIDACNKPIKQIISYYITKIEYEDGTHSLHRENSGFTAIELLGLLSFVKDEIVNMMYRKPTASDFVNVTRTVKNCKVTQIKKKDEISNRSKNR